MSNKEQLTRPQELPKTKWFQKASFPWMVLAILAALAIGFISGWQASLAQQQSVHSQAVQMVSELSSKTIQQK